MFVRLLIYLILGIIIYRALKSLLGGTKSQQVRSSGRDHLQADDTMIQDPQCGTYFARRDGVALHGKGQTMYFCSETCKDKYVERQGTK